MPVFVKLIVWIGTLLIIAGAAVGSEKQWVLIKEEHGVLLQSRKLAGYAESEFRGTRIIDQPIEVVGAVLADIPSYTGWFYNCIRAYRVPDNSATDLSFSVYIGIDVPWPFWNRDVVYAVTTTVEPASGKIRVQGHARSDTAVPYREDHVRIIDSTLEWTIEPRGSNQSRVTFTKRLNAGGNLGVYLSDAGCQKSVFYSLVNISEMAADPKYAEIGAKLRRKYGGYGGGDSSILNQKD